MFIQITTYLIADLLENCEGFEWGFLSAEMLVGDLVEAAMTKGVPKERERTVGRRFLGIRICQATGDLVSRIREMLEVRLYFFPPE